MPIYVIRHAQKAKGDYINDRLPLNDEPLSETGRSQALALVDYFRDIEISSIYVSEYIRTMETISQLAAFKNIQPIVDKRLNEINTGSVARMADEQIAGTYPDFWRAYLDRNRDFRFPEGESGDEAGARIYEAFCSLDSTHNHILVCHDGIIRSLICMVLSLPTYKRHLFRIDLCSLTIFDYLLELHCWQIPKINMVL